MSQSRGKSRLRNFATGVDSVILETPTYIPQRILNEDVGEKGGKTFDESSMKILGSRQGGGQCRANGKRASHVRFGDWKSKGSLLRLSVSNSGYRVAIVSKSSCLGLRGHWCMISSKVRLAQVKTGCIVPRLICRDAWSLIVPNPMLPLATGRAEMSVNWVSNGCLLDIAVRSRWIVTGVSKFGESI